LLIVYPKYVTTLYHPPYSPELCPPDYFLFPKSKIKLKDFHFADDVEIQGAVTEELKKVQQEEFFGRFSETVPPIKSLYTCHWNLF
jgi:hypothetical protein